jgi:phosphate transport system substrate-binding protein
MVIGYENDRKEQQVPSTPRFNKSIAAFAAVIAVLAFSIAGCGDSSSDSGSSDVSGNITVDGSSTVLPFAQASAETFQGENPNVKITVGKSGTGGGLEKFCAGEIDVADASRQIKPEEEAICKKNGITFGEVQVANDGITIVTNKKLPVKCLTTKELNEVWKKGSKVSSLSQVNSGLPSTKLSLYGPGTDSGTFDFFTGKINGEEGDSRTDYQPSEDDNVIVQGVSGDDGGLGYFGFSYYEQNKDKLNLVEVDGGKGCVAPSKETIQDGSYAPLSRPLYMYYSDKSIAQPQVAAFLNQTLAKHDEFSTTSQVVPMSEAQAAAAQKTLDSATSGKGATS